MFLFYVCLRKLLQRRNRPELGNMGSEKKTNIKQKITFPEISAFIEVCRLLWEQMKYVCVLWVRARCGRGLAKIWENRLPQDVRSEG